MHLAAGGSSVKETDLHSRYHTHCDPRLNAEQALEMAFYVGERLRQRADLGAGKMPKSTLPKSKASANGASSNGSGQ